MHIIAGGYANRRCGSVLWQEAWQCVQDDRPTTDLYPAKRRHWPDSVITLAHRLRRWSIIITASGQCLVFAGYAGMYAGRFTIPTLSLLQRQYLLTCKVSRYCIVVPHGISLSRGCQKRTPEQTLSEIGHWRAIGPALKHFWINASCLLVYLSSDVIDPDNVCVIGQGRLYLPMVCHRCRSASLRIFSSCFVVVVWDAIETHG